MPFLWVSKKWRSGKLSPLFFPYICSPERPAYKLRMSVKTYGCRVSSICIQSCGVRIVASAAWNCLVLWLTAYPLKQVHTCNITDSSAQGVSYKYTFQRCFFAWYQVRATINNLLHKNSRHLVVPRKLRKMRA